MYYYEVVVDFPICGYSVLVKSETELSEEKIIEKAIADNLFEDNEDASFVDYVNPMTEEEAKKWFNIN